MRFNDRPCRRARATSSLRRPLLAVATVASFAVAVQRGTAQTVIWTKDSNVYNEKFGAALAFIGDRTGDGVDDLAIGVGQGLCPLLGDGRLDVFETVQVNLLSQWCGSTAEGVAQTMCRVKDVDGDALDDIVISGPAYDDPVGPLDCGRIMLIGSSTGDLVWELLGEEPDDAFGSHLVTIGDTNGDGFDEVLASAPSQNIDGYGRAYVVSSLDGTVIRTHSGGSYAENVGASISRLGDVDGDGFADYAVGAALRASIDEGRADTYSGLSGALLSTWTGTTRYEHIGFAMCAAGDWDKDGHCDLLALAFDNAAGLTLLRVYSPIDGRLLTETSYSPLNTPTDAWGFNLEPIGDADTDGWIDFAVGAAWDSRDAPQTGRVDLYSGRTFRPFHHLYPEKLLKRFFGGVLASGSDVNGDGILDLAISAPAEAFSRPRGGTVFVYALNDLYLMATPDDPVVGDTVTVDLRAGPPGLLGLIVLTDVAGTSTFEPLLLAPFDTNGELQLCADVDSSVSGLTFTLRGYSQNRAGRGPLMDSIDVVVTVQ